MYRFAQIRGNLLADRVALSLDSLRGCAQLRQPPESCEQSMDCNYSFFVKLGVETSTSTELSMT